MKAKKMFEKLGYTLCAYDDDFVRYTKQFQPGNFVEVKFVILDRTFEVQHTYAGRTNSVCISTEIFKAIVQQCKELGWLEEQKQETNLEHHFEYLSTVGIGGFALINGKCVRCSDTDCTECDFNGDCCKKRLIWLASSYRKPTFKLTQFEYDLVHTYSDCNENCKFEDCEQLKRLKDKGYFKQIDNDELIENILTSCEVSE